MWVKVSKAIPFRESEWFNTLGLVDDNEYSLIINNCLEFEGSSDYTKSYKKLYLKTINEDDFLIRDASLEFEKEIKSSIEKLKEINLETKEDLHSKFINSLLNDK